MVRLIARVIGVGIETADMLVHEILSRQLRDRRAVARYAGPDESGNKRREKGLRAMHEYAALTLAALKRCGSTAPVTLSYVLQRRKAFNHRPFRGIGDSG